MPKEPKVKKLSEEEIEQSVKSAGKRDEPYLEEGGGVMPKEAQCKKFSEEEIEQSGKSVGRRKEPFLEEETCEIHRCPSGFKCDDPHQCLSKFID